MPLNSELHLESFGLCPTNGRKGKRVDAITLKALLAVPLTLVRPTEYRFCPPANCPTVFYSADGQQCFTEAELREMVYQKHPGEEDVPVCYCFRYTAGMIREELERTGETHALEVIKAGIRAGQCACDIRNPQGSCCLGNVRSLVERLQAEREEGCSSAR